MTDRSHSRIELLAAFVLGGMLCPEFAQAAGLLLEPCRIADQDGLVSIEARCGKFAVAENPDQPQGPKIELAVAVVPAVATRAKPDPLFLLDYVASGRLKPGALRRVFEGLAKACRENACSLVGGETAEMPGLYREGEYDLAATIVGVVDRKDVLPRPGVAPGDLLVGLRSTGLHTNGYTLARKTFGLRPAVLERRRADLGGSLADALLAVHRSYGPLLLPLLRKRWIKAMAHITGGGFYDNVPRVLPKDCRAVVDPSTWEPLPIFRLLCAEAGVSRAEAYRVFNMGIGMVLVVAPRDLDALRRALRRRGEDAPVIGEIRRGRGDCVLAS